MPPTDQRGGAINYRYPPPIHSHAYFLPQVDLRCRLELITGCDITTANNSIAYIKEPTTIPDRDCVAQYNKIPTTPPPMFRLHQSPKKIRTVVIDIFI